VSGEVQGVEIFRVRGVKRASDHKEGETKRRKAETEMPHEGCYGTSSH